LGVSWRRARLTSRQLEALIDEATADAYSDDGHATGLFTLMEEHLALPFVTFVWVKTADEIFDSIRPFRLPTSGSGH